jgi:hypothetical protein
MKSVISPDGAERLATCCGPAAACALSTLYIYVVSLHRWRAGLAAGHSQGDPQASACEGVLHADVLKGSDVVIVQHEYSNNGGPTALLAVIEICPLAQRLP